MLTSDDMVRKGILHYKPIRLRNSRHLIRYSVITCIGIAENRLFTRYRRKYSDVASYSFSSIKCKSR